MRVSVIIPLYNKAPYVARALDSVAAQTIRDIEVIVVDDGSTDGGEQIVESYTDTRFRLIKQENAGPGAARNAGISGAGGEVLAFLDADDEWLPEFLEECLKILDAHGDDVGAVSTGWADYPDGQASEATWRARGITWGAQSVTPDTRPAHFVYSLAYMQPITSVARAEVVRKWGGFYDRDHCVYAEDAHLWFKVLLNERVVFDPRPLARRHVDAAALSRNLSKARPVEPFLLHPEELENACPPHLRGLLARVLAARAFKTACVLGYWGDWKSAHELARRFGSVQKPWQLPYYLPSLICRTPVGALLGSAWRSVHRLRK